MVTMLIDHIGVAFFNSNDILRSIGRIAFPFYAFMLAECFRHIKSDESRVIDHLKKLIILAVVSEFAYDFFHSGFEISAYLEKQSNLLTLLISFSGLMAADKYSDNRLAAIIIYVVTSILTVVLNTDYSLVGVLLVYAFYWYLNSVMESDENKTVKGQYYKEDKNGNLLYNFPVRLLLVALILIGYLILYFFVCANFKLDNYLYVIRKLIPRYVTFIFVAFSIAIYNGKIGYNVKWFKVLFSWFYPLHLFVLGIIKFLC